MLIDEECIKPSRQYLVKQFINYGSNPNVMCPQINHTPLHWLAYWGDHRAARVLMYLNKIEQVMPNDINKYGAFNSYLTYTRQVPADIAGKLQHKNTLKVMVEYFMKKEEDNIRQSFIRDVKHKVDAKRFT